MKPITKTKHLPEDKAHNLEQETPIYPDVHLGTTKLVTIVSTNSWIAKVAIHAMLPRAFLAIPKER